MEFDCWWASRTFIAADRADGKPMRMGRAAESISGGSWHRVRFTRRTLALNDTPVALIPRDDHPEYLGLGLAMPAQSRSHLIAGPYCGSTTPATRT